MFVRALENLYENCMTKMFFMCSRFETIEFCSFRNYMKGSYERRKYKRVKNVERRKRLNDTYIKILKPKDKPYSIGDSEVVG